MNCDRVVIRKVRYGYDVEADGRISTYLCWGEMLDQLISLTHSDIKSPRYHTRTVEEEIADDIRRHTERPPTPADFAEVVPAPPPRVRCQKDSHCDQVNGHEGPCTDDIPF